MENVATMAPRHDALLRLSVKLHEYNHIQDLMRYLPDNLRFIVEFNCLSVLLVSTFTKGRSWYVGGHCGPLTLNAEQSDEQNWLRWAYECQQIARIPDPSFERSREWLAQRGLASGYAVPLTTANRRIGAMLLAVEQGSAAPTDESRVPATIAERVAIAIERLLLREDSSARHESTMLPMEVRSKSMFEGIVGFSQSLHSVLSKVARVAPEEATVLITGESGTGKELIARAIHNRSRRSREPFVRINCAAIPPGLIAAELFGYEKGAFTGANQRRIGRFESANGGTIFLDEIGDMPEETQLALLRVLQEREIERVGGNRSIPVDVRVLAATNHDLPAEVDARKFRLDLFYRLNVFPIELPPLRERKEDVLVLAKYFVQRFAAASGKNIHGIDRRSSSLLQRYDWPGNIRELQNVLHRAVILCDGETLCVDEAWLKPIPERHKAPIALDSFLMKQEKELIESTLKETRGRISGPAGAARRLGLPRTTLETRIRNLCIDKYRFRMMAGVRSA